MARLFDHIILVVEYASVPRLALRWHGSRARLSLRAMTLLPKINLGLATNDGGGTISSIKIRIRLNEQALKITYRADEED